MDTAEHIALAQIYLTASVRLEIDGIHQLAAEDVCGPATLAIEGWQHTRGLRHGSANDKRLFIEAMDAGNDGEPTQWNSGLKIVRDELHHHFYANHLSASEAQDSLALGRIFVERLIQTAATPGNQAGTP